MRLPILPSHMNNLCSWEPAPPFPNAESSCLSALMDSSLGNNSILLRGLHCSFFGVHDCANSQVSTPRTALTTILSSPLGSGHSAAGRRCWLMHPGGGAGGALRGHVLDVLRPCFSIMFHSLRRLDCVMMSSGLSCRARR